MAIQCPECGKGYDVVLFQFGLGIECSCGRFFTLKDANVITKIGMKYQYLNRNLEDLKKLRTEGWRP